MQKQLLLNVQQQSFQNNYSIEKDTHKQVKSHNIMTKIIDHAILSHSIAILVRNIAPLLPSASLSFALFLTSLCMSSFEIS